MAEHKAHRWSSHICLFEVLGVPRVGKDFHIHVFQNVSTFTSNLNHTKWPLPIGLEFRLFAGLYNFSPDQINWLEGLGPHTMVVTLGNFLLVFGKLASSILL